jgi:histidinol phosphatase-like PHP family hydrolase
MNIKHKIINLDNSDYHMHSMSFSDGMNTIDEIVKFAWEIGMTEIAITDHSDDCMASLIEKFWISKNAYRWLTKRWWNIHNEISVIFWVEADILNENWDICDTIQWKESEFINLSAHNNVYKWSKESINKAYKNAIEKHNKKIKFICHPCSNPNFWNVVDIEALIEIANKYEIPLEINWSYLYNGKTNLEKLHILLQKADKIYINSDAHTLFGLKEYRKNAIKFLKENGYI